LKLTGEQIKLISKYLTDISKIVFGSVVVNFFLRNDGFEVTVPVFIGGALMSIVSLWVGILLVKKNI